MCGIFGYSGDNVDVKILKILALYNKSRGEHATGIYSDTKGIQKDILDAGEFLAKNGNVFSCKNLFLGHNRFATHGENIKRNAHPFKSGKVVGIHNGVLYNHDELATQYKVEIEVDSQIIFITISNNLENEQDVLSDIMGAMTIAYTKGDGMLYLYKRDNPLFVGKTATGLYFSSIKDGLLACGIKEIYVPAENIIYGFYNGKLCSTREVAEPKIVVNSKNWYDYKTDSLIFDNSRRMAYSYTELIEFGLSPREALKLCTMDEESQYQHLYDYGYI